MIRSFLSLVTAAAAEPVIVSLADAKLHCRVDTSADDTLITGLIQTARDLLEPRTGRAFLTQRWTQTSDAFPDAGDPLNLPLPPLASSPAPVITYRDSSGALVTWDASNYVVVYPSGPAALRGYITPAPGKCWPRTQTRPDAVVVDFTCGVASAATLAGGIKSAMLLVITFLYENRDGFEREALDRLLSGIDALLSAQGLVGLA